MSTEVVGTITPEASVVGARLDQHHSPETNGRMAVCRRCGAQTDGPEGGHHLPSQRRLARSEEWLDAQKRARRIEDAKKSFGDRTAEPGSGRA